RAGLSTQGLPIVALARGLDQPAAQLRIAEAPLLLVERQGAQILPHGQPVERQLGLEREERGEPPAVHLGEHPAAGGGGLLEERGVGPPDVWRVLSAEEAERDGTSGLDGELAQAAVVVLEAGIAQLAVHALARDLEDARVHLAHDADKATDLVPRGDAARDRATVGRFVARRARRREAHGACGERAAQL